MKNYDDLDRASAAFLNIMADVEKIDVKDWSEADTRLKVIDRIFFDVLGWCHNDVKTEDQAGGNFTDYTLSKGQAACLIVEAKKDSRCFELNNRKSAQAYVLNGSAFSAQNAKEAVKQVIMYAAYKSCELGCATNGEEWIIFRPNRLGDGKNVMEGKAFIFTSLEDVKNNFGLFFDLLSKEAVTSLRYRGEFQRVEGTPIRDISFLKAIRGPKSKKLLPRGEFASDFDKIMASFFERMKGDQDKEMILKCFVETPESELADEKLLRIAEEIAISIKSLNTTTGAALVDLLESIKLQKRNKFILLVGSKGSGKTTFVDRFFKRVLPYETKKDLVLLRVDLAHHQGDYNNVNNWLNDRLIEELEKLVFTKQVSSEDIIGKAFFDEYQRWSQGTLKELYETDKIQFKIKFGEHIEDIRRNKPSDYIKRIVGYITKSNHKIPCLVFDNTDHFTIQFQENVFQYARAIYESELCVVILPITDKTSWQLSKQGAFQSFESESLYLPVPRPDKVLERRIEFIREKIHDDIDDEKKREYFLSRGIRLKISDIAAFVGVINKIFIETKDNAAWIAGLTNHDIRRLLELTKEVVASPHLKIDDLFKAYMAGTLDAIQGYRIKNAIIKKHYDIYPMEEHSFVQNVYAFHFDPPTTPLLGIRILAFLRDVANESDSQRYISVSTIQSYFMDLGINQHITLKWLEKLVETGLAFNYDPTIVEIDDESEVEISPSGLVHLKWAMYDADYVQSMSFVTNIRDKDIFEKIYENTLDFKKRWNYMVVNFIEYLLNEDSLYCSIPGHSNYEKQSLISKKMNRMIDKLKESSIRKL